MSTFSEANTASNDAVYLVSRSVIKYVSRNSTVGEHGTTCGDAKRQVSVPASNNGTLQGSTPLRTRALTTPLCQACPAMTASKFRVEVPAGGSQASKSPPRPSTPLRRAKSAIRASGSTPSAFAAGRVELPCGDAGAAQPSRHRERRAQGWRRRSGPPWRRGSRAGLGHPGHLKAGRPEFRLLHQFDSSTAGSWSRQLCSGS
jgi:hypothetical protein